VADFNIVVVSGVVTKEATLRKRGSGVAKAEFSLEVDRPFRRASGELVSDLFLVDVYGELAEQCEEEVVRGVQLLVVGTLNKESYVTRHGQREHLTVIKCKHFRKTAARDIDFGNVTGQEVRDDEWSEGVICDYLDALIEAIEGPESKP